MYTKYQSIHDDVAHRTLVQNVIETSTLIDKLCSLFLHYQFLFQLSLVGSIMFQSHDLYLPIIRKEINMILCFMMVIIACYNGAWFYIDVIGHKYYNEKTKTKTKT